LSHFDIPDSIGGLATFYRTGERNIVRYRAKGAPMSDPAKFKEWMEDQKSAPIPLMDRLEELLGGASDTGAPKSEDQDWKDFEAITRTNDPNASMVNLCKARDWAYFCFEKATRTGNKKKEKFYSDMLAKLEGVIHDGQLRAKKLGIEAGDLVPRKDLETPARFLGYHLLRCADAALSALAKAITERDPSLPPPTAEEIFALGEPLILRAVVFDPMQRAIAGDNGAAPPGWLVEALRAGLDEVVEDV